MSSRKQRHKHARRALVNAGLATDMDDAKLVLIRLNKALDAMHLYINWTPAKHRRWPGTQGEFK